HRDHLVVDLRVEDGGDEAGAQALELVRAGLAAGENRGAGRLDGDQLEGGLAGLDDLADARDGAARADAGDDDVDLAVGVLPYLLSGRPAVDGGVGGVRELLQDDAVRYLAGELLGLG